MHEELAAKIKQFKEIGIQYTFDGFVVAELLTQLDALAKVNYVEFKNNCLSIWVGDLIGTPKQVMTLLPAASLLGAMTSGAEETPRGYKLYFEWMLPKDIYNLQVV
jgi:hypothetical protein